MRLHDADSQNTASDRDEDIKRYGLRLLQIQHTEQISALETECAAELAQYKASDEADRLMEEFQLVVVGEWAAAIEPINQHARHAAYLGLLYKMTLRWLALYKNQLFELMNDHFDQPDARIAVNDAVIRISSREYALRHHAMSVGIPVEYYREKYI